MNVHLLIRINDMARITDQNKVDRLKNSTMKMVVENGFGGASAVLIAKDANVSAGYFYLHYKGKYAMVNTLLHDVYAEVVTKLKELIEKGSTFIEIIENLVGHYFEMANNDPVKLKFIYVLLNDYSFRIEAAVKASLFEFINIVKEIGTRSGLLDEKLTDDDLYLFLVINPIQFINQLYKKSEMSYELTSENKTHLLYLIQKFVRTYNSKF